MFLKAVVILYSLLTLFFIFSKLVLWRLVACGTESSNCFGVQKWFILSYILYSPDIHINVQFLHTVHSWHLLDSNRNIIVAVSNFLHQMVIEIYVHICVLVVCVIIKPWCPHMCTYLMKMRNTNLNAIIKNYRTIFNSNYTIQIYKLLSKHNPKIQMFFLLMEISETFCLLDT